MLHQRNIDTPTTLLSDQASMNSRSLVFPLFVAFASLSSSFAVAQAVVEAPVTWVYPQDSIMPPSEMLSTLPAGAVIISSEPVIEFQSFENPVFENPVFEVPATESQVVVDSKVQTVVTVPVQSPSESKPPVATVKKATPVAVTTLAQQVTTILKADPAPQLEVVTQQYESAPIFESVPRYEVQLPSYSDSGEMFHPPTETRGPVCTSGG